MSYAESSYQENPTTCVNGHVVTNGEVSILHIWHLL